MADLTDGAVDATTDAAELDTGAQRAVQTATGDAAYNVDWNGIESSVDPTLATLRLLHSARQTVDTSRWWTLRWPNKAISLLGDRSLISSVRFHFIRLVAFPKIYASGIAFWAYDYRNEFVEPRLLPTTQPNINPFRCHALILRPFSGERAE